MKRPQLLASLVISLMLSASTLCVSADLKAAPDFKALMQKTLDAWGTLDPANAAPFYAKDAEDVFYDLAPLKYTGWGEYEQGVKKLLADFTSLKLTVNDDARVHQHGSLAWATATFHGDAMTKKGERQALDGRWTVIWEKRSGKWLIVHEHFSLPLPPPPEK